MNVYDLLQTLTETAGPSGQEGNIASAIQQAWEPYVDEVSQDHLGNLLALKRGRGDENASGRRPRLLLAAHMDEIGLMVKQIEEYNGAAFLRLTNVGGIDIRHLYGQIVTVHGSRNGGRDLTGVLGSLPAPMLPEERRSNVFGFEDLLVDVGLPHAELGQWVAVGDFITFRQPLRKLLNRRVAGKALDNRASVAAVAVGLEYLSRRHHHWDVVAVATVQEETRLLGAYTTSFTQRPDVAIAIDVTFGKGPGASDSLTYELDEGPALGLGVNVHPGLFKALKEAASALELKVHTDPHGRHSGTDAAALQIAREGIPTGLVEIPLRYMHTTVETVAMKDIERAGRLLGEFAARLDGEFLNELAASMMD